MAICTNLGAIPVVPEPIQLAAMTKLLLGNAFLNSGRHVYPREVPLAPSARQVHGVHSAPWRRNARGGMKLPTASQQYGCGGLAVIPALRQRLAAGHPGRRTALAVHATAIRQLPIFPLGLVAFPTMEVPLTIFEARYRVLFSTLLADARDIDQELVQQDSLFRGSRQFGMCFVNNQVCAWATYLAIEYA